jgi:hypothetical protein
LYWLNIYEWNENVKQTQTCKRETQHQASAQTQQQPRQQQHSKRNRNQRGGKTKQEWCSILINFYYTECDPSKEPIKEAFNALQFKNLKYENCDLLQRLLTQRDSVKPSLAVIVGSNLSLDDIIKHESGVMTQILFLNDGFRPNWNMSISIDNKLANWLNFVRLIYRNMNDLVKQEPTYKPKPNPTPTPSKSQSSANAVEWRPLEVQRPQLPEGWTQSGPDNNPIYFNSINGHSQYEFPTMPAREFELAKRLAQINDDDYEPPPLTQKDQKSAKQSGAWLPDVKEVSAYDRLMAFNPDDDDDDDD